MPDLVDRRHVRPELRLVRRQSGDRRRCRRLAPPAQRPPRRAVDRQAVVRHAARGALNEFRRWLARRQSSVSVAVLVLLAYIPALTAAPGRMPSDSKLYVYLEPGPLPRSTRPDHVRPPPVRRLGAAPAHRLPVADRARGSGSSSSSACPTGWPIDCGSAPLLLAAGLGVRWVARRPRARARPPRSPRRSSTSSRRTSSRTCRARRSCSSPSPGSVGSSGSPCWPRNAAGGGSPPASRSWCSPSAPSTRPRWR